MSMSRYRVAPRNEQGLSGTWGLWSDERRRWIDVVFRTEREAADMLGHLIAAERRRDGS